MCCPCFSRSVKDLARLSLKSPVYVSPDENDEKSTPATLTEVYLFERWNI